MSLYEILSSHGVEDVDIEMVIWAVTPCGLVGRY
jgi:hypothetical protein